MTQEYIPSELTKFGFKFGGCTVERMCSDTKKGWVYIGVNSLKESESVRIYVTKTGKTRVYKGGKEMKVPDIAEVLE